MSTQTPRAPRRVDWRLTLRVSTVVGLATAATCSWLLGVQPGSTMLLALLGFVATVAVVGGTLRLLAA